MTTEMMTCHGEPLGLRSGRKFAGRCSKSEFSDTGSVLELALRRDHGGEFISDNLRLEASLGSVLERRRMLMRALSRRRFVMKALLVAAPPFRVLNARTRKVR